jgi:hypothetical protein
MARRGFDSSGDLRIDHDPLYECVFPFSNLLIFSLLAIAARSYRRRPEIHKRLMLFANSELMPAPLAHLIGHIPWLASLPAAIVMIPISTFVIAAVVRDVLLARRVHPLTWGLALLRLFEAARQPWTTNQSLRSGYIKGTITVTQDVLPYQTVPADTV